MRGSIATSIFSFFIGIAVLFMLAPSPALAGDRDIIRFAVMGDRTSGHTPGIFGQVLAEAERLRPEFFMSVGDYVEGYTDDSLVLTQRWEEFKDIVKDLPVPFYYVPGNNDIEYDIQERLFKKYASDLYYSFDYKYIHFIIVDNSRWETTKDLPEAQIEWLKQDLEANKEAGVTIVFMHKPFWYRTTAAGEEDPLHSLFVANGVDAVFCGHFHDYFSGDFDGIQYTTIGSSGGGMVEGISGLGYQFGWVTVDDDGIHIDPIKMDAVRAWDDVTVGDLRFVNKMKFDGVANNRVVIAEDFTIARQPFNLTIHNFSPDNAIDDTLTWDIPEGWTITPATEAISVAPGQDQIYTFTAAATANTFAPPTATIGVTPRLGHKADITHTLMTSREGRVAKAKKIKINGKLDESCWSQPITGLVDNGGTPTKLDPTEFYFAYDDKNLYLAAQCSDADMNSLAAKVTEQDGPVYTEDCVGYFIQPDINQPFVYQIYINPNGTVFDQRFAPGTDGYLAADRDWNGKYKIKCTKNGDGWIVETAIPLDQLGVKYKSGNEIALNFRRKQKRLDDAGNWQIPIDSSPKTFGKLILE